MQIIYRLRVFQQNETIHYRKSERDDKIFPFPTFNSFLLSSSSVASLASIQDRSKLLKNSLLLAYLPVETSSSTTVFNWVGKEIFTTALICNNM